MSRETERRTGQPTRAGSTITSAVLLYWLGRWDEALAELGEDTLDPSELTYAGLRERGPALLWHGVAALIAGRRNERLSADKHLAAGLALPTLTISDRENRDFLLAAQAVRREQMDDPAAAQAVLSTVLDRQPGEMTLTHQWLPTLTRLSIEVDDWAGARAAVDVCRREAEAETAAGRAYAAARWCQGILDAAPEPLVEAVGHYRSAGPLVDLASSLEDLAVVLAQRGEDTQARKAFNEAATLYGDLGAQWDMRRADKRLRRYSIRHGVRGQRAARGATGWDAMTAAERNIAALVAGGQSTQSIAHSLFLSPRTVQCHVSHILTKLGVRGRVEIAAEVYRRTGSIALTV
jgi:DNA-binding CsgD family transcriptional regulator